MLKHPRVTEARIARAISVLKESIYPERHGLRVEACHREGEPSFPPRRPGVEEYQPCEVGERWGRAWSTTWLRLRGQVPPEWKGRRVVGLVRLGGTKTEGFTAEGLVWHGERPAGAINVNRMEIPVAECALGGEEVDWVVEAAANPSRKTWSARPEAEPAAGERLFRLEQAELAWRDAGAWELYLDLSLAYEALLTLGEDTPRRGQLLRACNEAVNRYDLAEPASMAGARAALKEVLGRRNGETVHEVSAVGHAHIDTAWLWPLREAMRKCARTFATQLAYMEEDPEYVFCCSQAQQYAWMKEYYPTIYAGIREAVRRGQWEPVGSMWVEMDCNIPGGESLVRQILHGKRFFREEFGLETKEAWLPDVFGYPASLPQILRRAGIEGFVTQKMSWNEFNEFPHHTFSWEGLDGSQIFTHFPPADTYNGTFAPGELAYAMGNFKEHDRATRSLYLYGYGDGGGGPTQEMLERAKRLRDFEGLPKVRLEKAGKFLSQARAEAGDLPVWVGELYLEKHRGTYTTQARNKKGNRKSEVLLRDAEFFDAVAGRGKYQVRAGVVEDHRAIHDVTARHASEAGGYLERAWKLLMLNQFHDIIPGSSIGWVYRDSTADYAAIFQLAHAVTQPARQALLERIDTSGAGRPLVVFNTSGFARSEVISQPDGTPMHVTVPACGFSVADRDEVRRVASFAHPVEVMERKRLLALENGMLRVVFERSTGNIRSIRDHRHAREVLVPHKAGNVFQLHRDLPNEYDAWDVEAYYLEQCEEVGGLQSIEVIETSELRAVVRIERVFGKSRIVQRVSLCAASARIDFDTEVEWREEHRFLKVAFPVNARSPRATYEVQYGQVERPTHCNTSWDVARFEVCAQKWADLSEGDYGLALLNDCKHGYDIRGNVMRLSLLRAPTAPDAEADRGHHQFTYALWPHGGDCRRGGVIEQSYFLNMPLHALEAEAHAGELKEGSFFQVDRPGLVIEAIKRAEEEEAIIVRMYEAHGTRGGAVLSTRLPVRDAYHTDLLERNGAAAECRNGEIAFTVTPFQIVTMKLYLA